MYDILIIGAGITGTMLARKLSAYQLNVAIIDKENDIANKATMANSAIIHTGYDPEDGTLKAQLNVAGANQYEKICQDLHCQYKVVGAYIVATDSYEEEHLAELARRATERHIPFTWLTKEQARQEEPHLSDAVTKALNFYTTAVIYPWQVAIACCQVAMLNGTDLFLNEEVKSITKTDDHWTVQTTNNTFETKYVINAAGIGAETIDRMVTEHPGYTMTPRKGEYYVLDKNIHLVNHIIFPVPGPNGKGVLAVPTVYGNTLIGPNSAVCADTIDESNTPEGLQYVQKNISKTLQNVPIRQAIRIFAGLRPSSTCKDFIISELPDARHFIHIASIESPGLASAPGIADYVIDTILKPQMELIPNPNAVMTRKKPVVMSELTPPQRQQKIQENPLYGKIICRCEQISEGEIVDCIHETAGATTIKGVKKRVRPGMGKCQGGFCEPKVLEILARELNIDKTQVLLDETGSQVVMMENRS